MSEPTSREDIDESASDAGEDDASERRAPERSAAPSAAPQPRVVDENVIDAPSKNTLVILGVICAATLIMWAAGRAACNYHVPGESLTPRATTLEERTFTPKGVATEFVQAIHGGDFATARLLAVGEARAFVEAEAKSCPGECATRSQHRASLQSVVVVQRGNLVDHYVSTRTQGPAVSEHLLEIERDAKAWRVTRVLEKGAPFPELKPDPTPNLPSNRVPASIRAIPDGPTSGAPSEPTDAEAPADPQGVTPN